MWLVLALGQQSTNGSFKFWALPTAHTALLIDPCEKTAPLFSLYPACLLYAAALPTVFNALPLNINFPSFMTNQYYLSLLLLKKKCMRVNFFQFCKFSYFCTFFLMTTNQI